MKVKKFNLNNLNNSLSAYNASEEFTIDVYYPQETKIISINLVEIKTTENPSDLIFIIKKGEEEKTIPIYLFKTKFLFLNNAYILDTSINEDFRFDPRDFEITVEGQLNNFSIDFYYSTDQKNPYIKNDRTRRHSY